MKMLVFSLALFCQVKPGYQIATTNSLEFVITVPTVLRTITINGLHGEVVVLSPDGSKIISSPKASRRSVTDKLKNMRPR